MSPHECAPASSLLRPRVRRSLALSTAIGLLAMAVMLALVESGQIWLSHRGEPHASPLASVFVWILPPWLILALLASGVVALVRRFPVVRAAGDGRADRAGLDPRALVVHALAAAIFPLVHATLLTTFHATVREWFPWSIRDAIVRLLAEYYVWNVLAYAALATVLHARDFLRDARERERRELELRSQLSEARLRALRGQLHPHFLFNALNTVAMQVRGGDAQAAVATVSSLGELLRAFLRDADAREVPLQEEVALASRYLAIEKARFGDRVALAIDVPEELRGEPVPPLLLQPLLENAIRHGVARRSTPVRVELRAHRRDGALELEVVDDGPGLQATYEPRESTGIGLANTRARLATLYGESASLDVAPREGGGVRARIVLPRRPEPALTRAAS